MGALIDRLRDFVNQVTEEKMNVSSDTAEEHVDMCLSAINSFNEGNKQGYANIEAIVYDWCGTDNPTVVNILCQLAEYKAEL